MNDCIMKNCILVLSLLLITGCNTIQAPTSTARIENAHGLRIREYSLLQITVSQDPSRNGTYKVNGFGEIQLGSVGAVDVFGKTEREAEREIQAAFEDKNIPGARVKVRSLGTGYAKVRIMGAINSPGRTVVGANDGILLADAIKRAGGLRDAAKIPDIYVARAGSPKRTIPLSDMEKYTLKQENGVLVIPRVSLQEGDLVYVTSGDAPRIVHVLRSRNEREDTQRMEQHNE